MSAGLASTAPHIADPATGERIEVLPGTAVLFPAGWTGICVVHETMRNAYMLC